MNARVLLRGLLFIASLVGAVVAIKAAGLGGAFDKAWIDDQVRGHGLSGELLFLAVGGLFTAVGLPRQFVAFLGGYAFGVMEGTVWGVLAALLGCAAAFFYARWLGRDLVARRFPARLKKMDAFLSDNPFSTTLLIRLLPVGSNVAVNLTAGVSGVRSSPFLLGSGIGYVPQTLVFALAGSGAAVEPTYRVGLSVALFVISGMMGVWLYRRYRRGRAFDDDIDRAMARD